jgi:transcriptional regulator with XRE-family HTH domain
MREVPEKIRSIRSVTELVGLVKRGDRTSLFLLRERLGCSRAELAAHISIPESQLATWEENRETLSAGQQALWRVKLSDYLNLEIRAVLGTDNADLLGHFWDLLWRLS